ncbi:MAG: MBL fold metallo-hydrolase [Bacteroidetes bacterium 24-39-8]|jgi:phosphoribosyl 1,2-cyclic phosphate phosphodiesterase|nr:MAG: MBL fold metallo-hydrolase [Sphingobacteriia bacterium 35-40-8]OYZ51869.1 MAG: MBL fold metallo-hydrolase [Bacteroidetes bacterium 24-39-8]OZA62258.1 MAG: MBL fold metallo-hydrolase [Sphingobacteriia bacterium 39-39-8]HQR94089.1 MBL fold metallo-hydrolase [Sediminibacterium sp.]HQS55611.1 MBL fold metallo-hydrolase [Sediminibacterium sp.]
MSFPALHIQFLGTGTSTGIPMIGCDCTVCTSKNPKDNRLRSSILVQSQKTSLIVDTTPDFRYQMLRTHTRRLDAVLFTHPHKDHMAGLDDIRAFNFFSQKPMDIYANSLTEEAVKRDFYYAFADKKYPGVPELNLNTIDESPFVIGDIHVQPILVYHHKMPVFGFRFGDFTYITDANRIEDDQKELIKGSKVLVLNALRKEDHISHFTLQQAVDLAMELAIPEVYFTHISHQLGLHETINQELPPHIQLAYDGLELRL